MIKEINVTWADFQTNIQSRGIEDTVQYFEKDLYYYIYCFDTPFSFFCRLEKTSVDGLDFKTKYIDTNKANHRLSQPKDGQNIPKVATYKPTQSSATIVSHNWCDKTTWYQDSKRVLNETPTLVSGKTYQLANTYLIDAVHNKIFNEDNLSETISNGIVIPLHLGGKSKYRVEVRDNGTVLTEDVDYTVNYKLGQITFSQNYTIIGPLSVDYSYAQTSKFIVEAKPGYILNIVKAEIDVSVDVVLNIPIYFEVWVGNPYFNPSLPESPTNPMRIYYTGSAYNTEEDIISAANESNVIVPKFGNMALDKQVFSFNYAAIKQLKSSQLAQIVCRTKNDMELTGTKATSAFYVYSETEL